MYDKDNSGHLSGFELRQALSSAGYQVNNHILNIIMHRYGNKNDFVEFDDFLLCAVKIKYIIGKSSICFHNYLKLRLFLQICLIKNLRMDLKRLRFHWKNGWK